MDEDLKRNIMAGATWMRALYMLLFAIIFYVAEVVLVAVALVQLVIKLFSGQTNQYLKTFGAGLSDYFHQMVAFLAFHSEHKPFPFAPWPGTDRATGGASGAAVDDAADDMVLPEPPLPR